MRTITRYSLFLIIALSIMLIVFRGDRVHDPVNMTEVNDQTFEEEVRESEKPVLVYFWANWCGYCRSLTPVLDDLAKEYEGRVVFHSVDIDENPELVERYRIEGVPYVFLFKNGKAVDARISAYSADNYRNWIDQHL